MWPRLCKNEESLFKMMQSRLDYAQTAPDGLKAMLGLEQYARQSGLEPALRELVKIRASQINGCAFCLDMHTKDARAAGETEQRLYTLPAWRDTPFFRQRGLTLDRGWESA